MKIAVQCESPLLQQSLELFLAGHLTSIKQSELIIRDRQSEDDSNSIWISTDVAADVQKPFSRSQLLLAIESKLQAAQSVDVYNEMVEEEQDDNSVAITNVTDQPLDTPQETSIPDFELLEKRIAMLTREYQDNIMKAVRAFHG